MLTLAMFARIEIILLLVGLALLVGYQLLTGKINVNGLLLDKTGTGVGGYSPARLQLLLVTVIGAFYLISEVLTNVHQGNPRFPDIDEKWLLVVGASQSIYLGGKVNSLFGLLGKSNTTSNSAKGDS